MTSSVSLTPLDLARMVSDALGKRVNTVQCRIDKKLHLILNGLDPEKSILGVRIPRVDIEVSAIAKPVGRYAIEVVYEVVTSRIVGAFLSTEEVINAIRLPFCRLRSVDANRFIINLDRYRVEECRIPADPQALEVRFTSDAA